MYVMVSFESSNRRYTYKYIGNKLPEKNQLLVVEVPKGFKFALAKTVATTEEIPPFECKKAFEDLTTMRKYFKGE